MSDMFKEVIFHGAVNERTGYGVHASRFTEQLSKLIPVKINGEGGEGAVHISLLDVVTASHTTVRHPAPSILYTVWESTLYPAEFMDKIRLYDQMWVVSEWERACAIAQGIPEEFIKVVHEGVDPDTFYPLKYVDEPMENYPPVDGTFNFLHVGQWQPRKSTKEICEAFLKAFPGNDNVRLYLSADTLFPSDTYKSTEERLKAYGLDDPRIIPVRFEDRSDYVRRLQSAHCFVSCSRAEGWNLPLCEAMACGVPVIAADWGGSTEYAGDGLLVRVPELRKPEGIYGNWDVPGKWGEPDYNHLVEVMQDAYQNYAVHKEKALKTSEMIRTKFSWAAAAVRAYEILGELYQECGLQPVKAVSVATPPDSETEVRLFARQKGYEIKAMERRKAIFAVDCWPSSQDKMDTLTETIKQIQGLGYPVLVTSHYPLPAPITALADYYIYEKRDIMSGDDKPIYWRRKLDGTEESKQCGVEYQGVAAINCFRNAIDFCRGRFDWIYQMGSDMEVDLEEWLRLVHASDKPMVCIPYEGRKDGFGGGLWAGRTETLDKVIPYLDSWAQYVNLYPDVRFVAERWIYNYVASKVDIDEAVDWIEIETTNRFDNVDRNVWADDEFQVHFAEGPFLNIVGLSNREYDVTFSNPIDGNHYTLRQKPGMWARPDKKFYRDWTLTATLEGKEVFRHHLELKGQNVIVSFGSKAMGDTIAWIPYVEEFRKKHGCNVYCSTWWNNIMDYPEIHFIKPGDAVDGVYATYDVGCFDDQLDRNPENWRTVPLQKVAADILGLDYEPIRARLKYEPYVPKGNGHEPKPYVCFSEMSTMQNKCWNREGAWQRIIDHLNGLGYDCVSISAEQTILQNVIRHNGQSIEQTLTDLSGASFYIGLNAGPTWLATAMGLPVVLITGVSEEFNDFPNPYRVAVDVGCKPCFNDMSVPINRDWNWCHSGKNFACTREITEEMVMETIQKLRIDNGWAKPARKKRQPKIQAVQEARL